MMIRFFWFQEKSVKDIVLKAMGQAISKTVAISEILKVSVFLLMNFVKYLSSNWDLYK
jgi:DNA-binding protein